MAQQGIQICRDRNCVTVVKVCRQARCWINGNLQQNSFPMLMIATCHRSHFGLHHHHHNHFHYHHHHNRAPRHGKKKQIAAGAEWKYPFSVWTLYADFPVWTHIALLVVIGSNFQVIGKNYHQDQLDHCHCRSSEWTERPTLPEDNSPTCYLPNSPI